MKTLKKRCFWKTELFSVDLVELPSDKNDQEQESENEK